MKRLIALGSFGVGYVLGARAGRERYDQLVHGFRRVRENPRVQEQAQHVAEVAKEQAPVVKEKVGDIASSAVHKVRPSSSAGVEDAEDPLAVTEDLPLH